MKRDVTDIVQRYRQALCYVWNSCIWTDHALRNWDSVDSFRLTKLPLFQALVATALDIERSDLFGKGFELAPKIDGIGIIPQIQVNSRRPSEPSAGTWLPISGSFKSGDLSLTLVDLFDWSPLGYIDLRYYVALIDASAPHPDLAGQHALIDVMHASVFWNDDERVGEEPDTSGDICRPTS